MREQVLVSMRLIAAVIVFVYLAGVSARGQTQAGVSAAKPAGAVQKQPAARAGDRGLRRLPDGQPDMQGIYVPNWPSTVPIERWTEAELKAHAELLVRMRGGY